MVRFSSVESKVKPSQGYWLPVALFSFASCICTTSVSQELELSPAPLVFADSSFDAPQKLKISGVSSIIPSAKLPFVLPTPKSALLESVPLVPSIAREYVNIQETEDPNGSLLDAPALETEKSDASQDGTDLALDTLNNELTGDQEIDDKEDRLMDDLLDTEASSDLGTQDIDDEFKTTPNQVWRLKTIHDVTFQHSVDGAIPEDRSASLLSSVASQGSQPYVGETVHWVAPNIYYQPLLFEDALLERYGRGSQVWGVQPARSGVHFAIDSFLMPMRAIKYHCEIETPLSFQRPGTCNQPTNEIILPRN